MPRTQTSSSDSRRTRPLGAGRTAHFERRDEKELRFAFAQIVGKLPRRPEPRGVWDHRTRSDNPVPHPNHVAVDACRAALKCAIETGDDEIVYETRLRIEAYFDECRDASLDVGVVLHEIVPESEVVAAGCAAVSGIVAAKEANSPGMVETAKSAARRAADRFQGWMAGQSAKQRAANRLEMW